jgi:hypothetical protein
MKEIKELMNKTGVSKKLLELGLPEGKSNNGIDSLSVVESFWVSIWISCFRFSHTAEVRLYAVLCQIFGRKRVASGTKFGRFFKKFKPSMNHLIFFELYSWFFEQLQIDNLTSDVDSIIITRYGEQEGARRATIQPNEDAIVVIPYLPL